MAGATAISTEELLAKLNAMEESPWGDLKGRPLESRGLAARLRKYSVAPMTVRIGADTFKGYRRQDLFDAWSRYLPDPMGTDTSDTTDTSGDADDNLSHPIASVTSVTSETSGLFEEDESDAEVYRRASEGE